MLRLSIGVFVWGMGISKVNISTEIKNIFTKTIKEIIAQEPDFCDPRKYLSIGKEQVKKVVIEKMNLIGSMGASPTLGN